jgi:hypothetical protein
MNILDILLRIKIAFNISNMRFLLHDWLVLEISQLCVLLLAHQNSFLETRLLQRTGGKKGAVRRIFQATPCGRAFLAGTPKPVARLRATRSEPG